MRKCVFHILDQALCFHLLTCACRVVLAAVGLVGLQPPGRSLGDRLHPGPVSFYGESHYEQRIGSANTLQVF